MILHNDHHQQGAQANNINMHSSGLFCSRKVCSQHLQLHSSDKFEEKSVCFNKYLHCKQYILPLTSPRSSITFDTTKFSAAVEEIDSACLSNFRRNYIQYTQVDGLNLTPAAFTSHLVDLITIAWVQHKKTSGWSQWGGQRGCWWYDKMKWLRGHAMMAVPCYNGTVTQGGRG